MGGRERDRERKRTDGCVEHACVGEGRRELNEERRLANEREERSAGGGIRLAREKEGPSRWESDGDIVEAHIHIHTPHTHTHSPMDAHTEPSSSRTTDCQTPTTNFWKNQ